MLKIYRARHVFPVTADPLIDGGLAVEDGRIVAVGPSAGLLARYPAARLVDLGESALLPAAVNAHTHLELTGLDGAIPEELPFAEWIVALVRARRQYGFDDFTRFAEDGIASLRAAGTAAVGEICTYGASALPLVESGLRGVLYYEVLGVDPEAGPALLESAKQQIQRWQREYAGTRVSFGLSLHATYTVSARLFSLASEWCAGEGIPLCIHAAESPAESEWLLDHTGPLRDVLYAAAGWPVDGEATPGCTPVTHLERLGALAASPLLAHGVHVGPNELRVLRDAGAAVAHCPRSNARLQCGRLPLGAYRAAGVPLSLGTDSLASSPSLSVWDEVVAAQELHATAGETPDAHELLRLATLNGALALGVDAHLGSLEPGKDAEMAFASLGPLDERARADSTGVLQAWADGSIRPTALRA